MVEGFRSSVFKVASVRGTALRGLLPVGRAT